MTKFTLDTPAPLYPNGSVSFRKPKTSKPEVVVTLHQYENGMWTLAFDKKLRGDSRPFSTKQEAEDVALCNFHQKEDGRWGGEQGNEWVEFVYRYQAPVMPGQARAMSRNDNS